MRSHSGSPLIACCRLHRWAALLVQTRAFGHWSSENMGAKLVYRFGGGRAEGTAGMKDLLGGKGANLAEMCSLGLPVPPGFTITTEVCTALYKNNGSCPEGL